MSLKSTFNIAGLTLTITCDEKTYAQGSQNSWEDHSSGGRISAAGSVSKIPIQGILAGDNLCARRKSTEAGYGDCI